MFGITRLTPEEKAEHVRKKRIDMLEKQLQEQTELRASSLQESVAIQAELENLRGEE